MSYYLDILTSFEKLYNRKVLGNHLLINEAEETVQQDQAAQQELQNALQHAKGNVGKDAGTTNPYLAKNGNKIKIYTTEEGLTAFQDGINTYNQQTPDFQNRLIQLLSKQEPEQKKSKGGTTGKIFKKVIGTVEKFVDQMKSMTTLIGMAPTLFEQVPTFLNEDLGESARNLLQEVMKATGCTPERAKKAPRGKIKPLLPIDSNKCDPNKFAAELQRRLFGESQGSIGDRIYESAVLKLDSEGNIDSSELTPEEVQLNVKDIFNKMFDMLGKEKLDAQDINFIQNRISWIGSGDGKKLTLTSEDGSFKISLGNRGSAEIIAKLLLEKAKKDTNGLISDFKSDKGTSQAFSAALGNTIEKMTNARIHALNLQKVADECKTTNPKLCGVLNAKAEEAKKIYALHAYQLAKACDKLSQFGFSKDVIGNSDAVDTIEQFRNEIYEVIKKDGIDLNSVDHEQAIELIYDKVKKIGATATLMIQQQPAVASASWSSLVGKKRGSARKTDVLLFYFDEASAEKAKEATGSQYKTSDLDDPELISTFENGENDPEYLLLKDVCKDRGISTVRYLKPSLKVTTSERGEFKISTATGQNIDQQVDVMAGGNIDKYIRQFNENYAGNMGELTEEEVREHKQTTYRTIKERAKEAGVSLTDRQIEEGFKEARKWTAPLSVISTTPIEADTVTLGGKEVTHDTMEKIGDMLSQSTKGLEVELESSDVTSLDTKLAQSVVELVGGAQDLLKKGDPASQTLAKEQIMKALNICMNAKRKKMMQGNSEEAKKQRLAFACEMQLFAGAHQYDIPILAQDYSKATNSCYGHNRVTGSFISDVLSNNFTMHLTDNGYRLEGSSVDPTKTGPSISKVSKFTGKTNSGGSHEARVNKQGMDRGLVSRTDLRKQGSEVS